MQLLLQVVAERPPDQVSDMWVYHYYKQVSAVIILMYCKRGPKLTFPPTGQAGWYSSWCAQTSPKLLTGEKLTDKQHD